MKFDTKRTKEELIQWIKTFFLENGKNCNAIVGISGGKDSSIVAALCVEALGANRVIGVLMPNGTQSDITFAQEICMHLGIESITINIKGCIDTLNEVLYSEIKEISEQTAINLPARIRMAVLYAVSQSRNGRVANTCNLSEDWVGYATRYGDGAGDFSPLSNLTVTEVKKIGMELNIPKKFVDKVPTDGLCGKTDEENLGFSYAQLDQYIREGIIESDTLKEKIDNLHEKNLFKLKVMPSFPYSSR